MLDKFRQDNNASNVRRWIKSVDLSSADILNVEREIYTALAKSQKNSPWLPSTVAPLAEPVDLTALVGDIFTSAQGELAYQVGRIDNFYTWLAEANNVLKAEIETVEKAILEATDDIQSISMVIGDENKTYHWVSDSFNNTTFVDQNATTCLVDTDYGTSTLGPSQMEIITDYVASIDRENTRGIPGCNLYVVNKGTLGTSDKEPVPILESSKTKNLGSLFDNDASSWFEIERNFIPPVQKIKMEGRSYVYDEAGAEKSVREITKDFDWTACIQWPDGYQDNGADSKGVSLVEWRNLDSESTVYSDATSLTASGNPACVLVLYLTLNSPVALSSIKILPLLRERDSKINVRSVKALVDGNWVDIIHDVELGSNKSTTRLQQEILRRTGIQLTGSVFGIPTDRMISQIRIELNSMPTSTSYGLAHIFKDVYKSYRTERNYGLWTEVQKYKKWGRVVYNETIPTLTSTNKRDPITGTIISAAKSVYSVGTALSAGITAAETLGTTVGGTLGAVGSWLGTALPYVGALLALDQLAGGLFAVKHTETVLETRVGYDVFKGHRAAIALRDITLLRMQYTEEGVIQSIKREFTGPVSKIGLFVDEYVPEYWGPGDWITYYISTDGSTWKPIPKLTDATLDSSITLDTPSKAVFFKAVMKGNTDDPHHSPQLRHYALQGLPS